MSTPFTRPLRILRWLRDLAVELDRHNAFQLAAALSYYTLLSFAPLVLVVIALAGMVFERSAVETHIVTEVRALVGAPGADVVETILKNAREAGKGVAMIVGIVTLWIGASTVFVQLQAALNRLWEVPSDSDLNSIRRALVSRLLSMAMIISMGFLLLASLVVSAGIAAAQEWFHARIALAPLLSRALDMIGSFAAVAVVVALLLKFLPKLSLAWRDVWFGAFVTAALFTLGKSLIGEYLGRATLGSAYGAAGSVVVLMVWTYYSAVILFLGAILARRRSLRRTGDGARVMEPVRSARTTTR